MSPESTVELLKRAVDHQAKALDKPKPDKRELVEETQAEESRRKSK